MQIGTDLVHTKDFRDIFIDVEEKVRVRVISIMVRGVHFSGHF